MPVCLIVFATTSAWRGPRSFSMTPSSIVARLTSMMSVLRIDVLGAVRARVAVRAQPQVIFADLRDALFALAVAHVFDEAVGVRDRGRAGERRIDADHRAERVARRAHHAVRDGDELLHVLGRNAALASCVESSSAGCRYGLRREYLSQNGSMWTTRSFMGWKFGIGSTATRVVAAQDRVARRLAREPGDAVDVHRARTADRRTARTAELIEPSTSALAVLERVEHGHRSRERRPRRGRGAERRRRLRRSGRYRA